MSTSPAPGYGYGQANQSQVENDSPFGDPGEDAANRALTAGNGYQFIGANPYQGGWDNLIAQLRQQSMGTGPSMAGNQYMAASQDAMNQQLAMSHGRSAGAARGAAQNMSNIGMGQAQGYADAALKERLGATAQLGGALQGAGQAWWQPQQANQNYYLQTQNAMVNEPSQAQQFAGLMAPMFGGAASMSGGGK